MKIDHTIDVRYEPDLIKMFNKFIKKWCGSHHGHLIDTDENDGQYIRERLEELLSKLPPDTDTNYENLGYDPKTGKY